MRRHRHARYQVPGNLSAFDAFTPFPDTSARGRPLPTARNLAELCRRTGVTVRYNVIRKDLEILVPGLQSTVDNAKEVAAGEVMDCMHRAGMATASFETNLCQVAEANPYNPVASWITSRPWDGQSRLQAFFDTVQEAKPTRMADGRVLKEVLMRRWLISGVAAAFEPDGVVARGVLTFVSKQNLGKTRWARQLAPAELQLIADGVVLDPANKDSVKQVISKWIVELGEVDATFRRTDIAALKSFISRSHDEIRRPYARTESRYARRTILFASVNDERFLRDATGNTRWWTVHAVALGEPARIDMQQVWAEAHALYCDGETWHCECRGTGCAECHQQRTRTDLADRRTDRSPFRLVAPCRTLERALPRHRDRHRGGHRQAQPSRGERGRRLRGQAPWRTHPRGGQGAGQGLADARAQTHSRRACGRPVLMPRSMMVATLTAAATTGACTAKHVACCNWTATGAWATTGAGRRSVRAGIASSISRVSWPHAARLSVSAWQQRHCGCRTTLKVDERC
jgi:hypothetical protein